MPRSHEHPRFEHLSVMLKDILDAVRSTSLQCLALELTRRQIRPNNSRNGGYLCTFKGRLAK
jgi:hypothetical protein